MGSGTLTRFIVQALDRAGAALHHDREADQIPEHLVTGAKGEEEAYFYLRKNGYTVVARNWRTPRRKGELDIVAWDHGTLAFVEVKTRTSRGIVPAELAVDHEKQRELVAMAQAFMRYYPEGTPHRFDVVSVYMVPGEAVEVQLFKDAFDWRTINSTGRRQR